MSAPFQTIPITHLDLTSQRGRQVLQDIIDQITAQFSAARITTAHINPETIQQVVAAAAFVGARVDLQANQAVTTGGTGEQIDFAAAATSDTHGFHSATVNPGRLTVPAGLGGYYDITGFLSWAANATGVRVCQIDVFNSASTRIYLGLDRRQTVAVAGEATAMTVTLTGIPIPAGGYVRMVAYHTRGADLNALGIPNGTTYLSVRRVAGES